MIRNSLSEGGALAVGCHACKTIESQAHNRPSATPRAVKSFALLFMLISYIFAKYENACFNIYKRYYFCA
jgi:hypothetical protein